MKYLLVVVGLAAIVLALSARKKQYRTCFIAGFLAVLVCLCAYTGIRSLGNYIALYNPTNQHFYQPEFLEDGVYPDAVLPLMVKGTTIYTKNDFSTMTFDVTKKEESLWETYQAEIYRGINACNLMRLMGAEVVSEDSYNAVQLSPEQKATFSDLGSANDMYRHSFAVNDIDEEWGNYFHYYWFYTAYGEPMHVYLNMEDYPSASDELVLIWDNEGEEKLENMYLMSKEYFDKEVAR